MPVFYGVCISLAPSQMLESADGKMLEMMPGGGGGDTYLLTVRLHFKDLVSSLLAVWYHATLSLLTRLHPRPYPHVDP